MRAMEPEPQPPEVLVEEEPRYLRRQKPLEIKRRKFGRTWQRHARFFVSVVAVAVLAGAFYEVARFLLFSPQMALASLDQIEMVGNRHVPGAVVLDKFAADRGRSVLRIPLDKRRRALEEIPWVEQATCQRILPNRIRVELVERAPVAFLRAGTELALIDAYGVILERPLQGEFLFPVVTGMDETMERGRREKRMRLYMQFLKEVERARPGATQQVSEVDLSDSSDLHATLAGLPELGDPAAGGQGSVLVHFGAGDFLSKFRMFVENIGQWRAAAGRVESVDLRFDRQVVVNPEGQSPAPAQSLAGARRAR